MVIAAQKPASPTESRPTESHPNGSRAAEIGVEGIGKKYGSFVALQDVSLTIGRGEFLTLLGPSGSGKTTFLMTLAGFEAPSSGRMTLDGRDITNLPAEQRGFGMVFQGYALFPHMSVADNIAFPLKVNRLPAGKIRERVADMVSLVGLDGHADKRPSALSGGQQQRVALARALASTPPVMLLDEPFSALDKNLRGQMQDEMKRLHRDTGTTFVFVTHDQSEALALSSRVAIFNRGMLQQVSPPREIYEQPSNRFVAEFLGEINMLTFDGLRHEGSGRTGLIGGRRIRSMVAGAGEVLALRPEQMRLALQEPPAERNAIKARLIDLTYQGAETRLSLSGPAQTGLSVLVPTAQMPPTMTAGADVWLEWEADQGIFLPAK